MDTGVADATAVNWGILSEILKGFLAEAKITNENLDFNRYFPIFQRAEVILTKSATTPTPSVFKQSAAFLLSFITEAPLRSSFPETAFDPKITSVSNHQNVIVAFEYVRFMLEGAVIKHSTRGDLVLKKPIQVSPHYFCDLVHCLSVISKQDPLLHFGTISILLESLVYAVNPDIADRPLF